MPPRQQPDPVIGPQPDRNADGTWDDFGDPDLAAEWRQWNERASIERSTLFHRPSPAGAFRYQRTTLLQATRPRKRSGTVAQAFGQAATGLRKAARWLAPSVDIQPTIASFTTAPAAKSVPLPTLTFCGL